MEGIEKNMSTQKQNISLLEREVSAATKRLVAACSELWPEGTEISFWYSQRARNCTIGTVVAHHGSRIGVRLNKLNRRGYQTVKYIHWSKIS